MKRKFIIFWTMIMALFLMLTACSGSGPKDSDVEDHTRTFGKGKILEENETITKIEIKNRDTDKKQKTDKVLTNITTEKDDVSYEKKVTLSYRKYNKGWEIENISVNDSEEWIVKPLKGMMEENIPDSIVGEYVTIDGEDWYLGSNAEFKVQDQKTDLEKGTDRITLGVVITDAVEKASGTIIVNYEFSDRAWKKVSAADQGDFKVEEIPEKAIHVDENTILDYIAGVVIPFGRNEMTYVDPEDTTVSYGFLGGQDVAVSKDDVTEFAVDKQEAKEKGTQQYYTCSGKVNTGIITYKIQVNAVYAYYEGEWLDPYMEAKAELESIDLAGKWTGRYSGAGDEGTVEMELTEESDGTWSAVYSYNPDEYMEAGNEPGSYEAKGTFDKETLELNLKVGDWVEAPKSKILDGFKRDIRATYYIEDGTLKGIAQFDYPFEVTKAE